MRRIISWIKWIHAMGARYICFRVLYELKRKTGILKGQFPTDPPSQTFITLADWRIVAQPFFFNSRKEISIHYSTNRDKLAEEASRIKNGEIQYFNGEWKQLELHDWLTNSLTGHKYSNETHWTEIPDFDAVIGDIKYVWEKSRFNFLQTIMRSDAANEEDTSTWVFGQIESWIDCNPINQGPNYRCSQETSLRIFNWIMALYFYKDSVNLTEERFQRIIFSVYWQVKHVWSNIHFSRIAVRNNHAITETLALYTAGLLFPFFKESNQWKVKGKKWLEQELLYQIYEDGSYLQFSFNYHRVVIQLLTWVFSIAKLHKDRFSDQVYERAFKSINLLASCQDVVSGELPNYGANDGSLFFKWNEEAFRNYKPSLDALHYALTSENLYETSFEDRVWFGLSKSKQKLFSKITIEDGAFSFPKGGIYALRLRNWLFFVNCVNYKDRPSQADNLHLDVWCNGQNLLRDAGSFQYNTNPVLAKYFFGTESHNTVMLGDADQMVKGTRFIWLNWTQASNPHWSERNGKFCFSGSIRMFLADANVIHKREIEIDVESMQLQIADSISHSQTKLMRQLWHVHPDNRTLKFLSYSKNGETLVPVSRPAYYSPTYGIKEQVSQIEFSTFEKSILTKISLQ